MFIAAQFVTGNLEVAHMSVSRQMEREDWHWFQVEHCHEEWQTCGKSNVDLVQEHFHLPTICFTEVLSKTLFLFANYIG